MLFDFFIVCFSTYYLAVISQANGPILVPAYTLQSLAVEETQTVELLLKAIDTTQFDDMLPDTRIQLYLLWVDHMYLLYLLAPE